MGKFYADSVIDLIEFVVNFDVPRFGTKVYLNEKEVTSSIQSMHEVCKVYKVLFPKGFKNVYSFDSEGCLILFTDNNTRLRFKSEGIFYIGETLCDIHYGEWKTTLLNEIKKQ